MKKIVVLALAMLVLSLGAFAAKQNGAFENAQNDKGSVEHLYLYEKNDSTWVPVEDGAWGKLTYEVRDNTTAEEKFNFDGHGLIPGENYSLIYYRDPWPGYGSVVIGEATANNGGQISVKGVFDFDNIPCTADPNAPGAKIWLVLSSDLAATGSYHGLNLTFVRMVDWNPAEYLFEGELLEQ